MLKCDNLEANKNVINQVILYCPSNRYSVNFIGPRHLGLGPIKCPLTCNLANTKFFD